MHGGDLCHHLSGHVQDGALNKIARNAACPGRQADTAICHGRRTQSAGARRASEICRAPPMARLAQDGSRRGETPRCVHICSGWLAALRPPPIGPNALERASRSVPCERDFAAGTRPFEGAPMGGRHPAPTEARAVKAKRPQSGRGTFRGRAVHSHITTPPCSEIAVHHAT